MRLANTAGFRAVGRTKRERALEKTVKASVGTTERSTMLFRRKRAVMKKTVATKAGLWLSALLLCIASTGTHAVGPPKSSELDAKGQPDASPVTTNTKLNVIVPVFDVNLPEDPDDYLKEGVWPELRNIESTIFAMRIRKALEDTRAFGAVRVTPNDYSVGELYVLGKIIRSTSETIELQIKLTDITQKQWLGSRGKKFKYQIPEYNQNAKRFQGQDPYQPIYDEIASEILNRLARVDESDLVNLTRVSNVVLAQSYSEENYSQYLRARRGVMRLRGYPADTDEKFQRVKELRVVEELFTDKIRQNYQQFLSEASPAYYEWQRASYPEARDYRLQREKARNRGALALAAGVLSAVAGNRGGDTAEVVSTTTAVLAAGLIFNAFRENEESKVYADRLEELGRQRDFTMTDTNVRFENEIRTLSGDAAAQMQQFREALQVLFDRDETPQIQL